MCRTGFHIVLRVRDPILFAVSHTARVPFPPNRPSTPSQPARLRDHGLRSTPRAHCMQLPHHLSFLVKHHRSPWTQQLPKLDPSSAQAAPSTCEHGNVPSHPELSTNGIIHSLGRCGTTNPQPNPVISISATPPHFFVYHQPGTTTFAASRKYILDAHRLLALTQKFSKNFSVTYSWFHPPRSKPLC
jgi:hypothetical protein